MITYFIGLGIGVIAGACGYKRYIQCVRYKQMQRCYKIEARRREKAKT